MVMESIRNTGIVPEKISADDGYFSGAEVEMVKSIIGIKHVHLLGAKMSDD